MFGIGINLIFFVKAVLFAAMAIILIPREYYKKHLIYGLFLGAGLDIVIIVAMSELGVLKYLNMGAFSVFGLFPFWTPIAWMFTLMIFLYFLPRRASFFYTYILLFSLFGIFLGKVLSNFGLYRFNPLILFFVFLAWFYFAGWVYLKYEKIRLQ